MQREAHAKTFSLFGKASTAAIFWWDDTTGSDDRVRTRLSRGEINQKWECYSDAQRIYNGFTNEWDVCSDFGDNPSYLDDFDDDIDGYDPIVVESTSAPSSPQIEPSPSSTEEWVEKQTYHGRTFFENSRTGEIKPIVPPISSTSPSTPLSEHQWHDTLSPDYGHPVESAHLTFVLTFTDTLYECYGFLNRSNTTDILAPKRDWSFILKCFGQPSSTKKTDALHGLVSLFLDNMLSDIRPSSSIWDLGEDCNMPLAEASQDSPFQVLPIIIEGDRRYIVSSKKDSTVPWVLEFRDPAIVLECLRRQEPTMHELAIFLSQHGAPFNTRLRQSQIDTTSAPHNHRPFKLGWRKPLDRGSHLEYNFYVESRNTLLNRPHGRAALLERGIIWRLAIDGLGPLAETLILDGPSSDVLKNGVAVKCSNDQESWLWDDALSDSDKDVICGVYRVYTSQLLACAMMAYLIPSMCFQMIQTGKGRQWICLGGLSHLLLQQAAYILDIGLPAANIGSKRV